MDDCGDKYVKEFEKRFSTQSLNGIELGGLCDCKIYKERRKSLKL